MFIINKIETADIRNERIYAHESKKHQSVGAKKVPQHSAATVVQSTLELLVHEATTPHSIPIVNTTTTQILFV